MINLKENDQLPQYVRDIVDFYTNQQNELKSLQEETNQIGFDCNSKKFVAISPTKIHTDCKFIINNIQSVKFQELVDLIENLVLKVCDFYDVDKKLSLSLFLNNCLPTDCYTKEDYFNRVNKAEITKDATLWFDAVKNNPNISKLWFYIPTVTFLIPFDSLKKIKLLFDRYFVRIRTITDKTLLKNQNIKLDDIQKWNNRICLFFIKLAIFNETVEITKKQLNSDLIVQILDIDKDLTIKNYVEEFVQYYLSVYDYDTLEYTACQLSIVNEIIKTINKLSQDNYQSIFKFLYDNDVLNTFSTTQFKVLINHYIFVKLNNCCNQFDLNNLMNNLQILLTSLHYRNVFKQDIKFDVEEYEKKQKLLAVILNSSKIPDFPIEIRIDDFKDWNKFSKFLKPNTEYNYLTIKLNSFYSDDITFIIQLFKIKKQLKQNNIKIKIVKEKLFD